MFRLLKKRRGQVTLEVAVLFGAIVAALVMLAIYLQRGMQGGVKDQSDRLGGQFSGQGTWSSTTVTATTSFEDPTTVTTTQDQTLNYNQTLP